MTKNRWSSRDEHHEAKFAHLWQPGCRVRFDMFNKEPEAWGLEDDPASFEELKAYSGLYGVITGIEVQCKEEICNVNVVFDDGFKLWAVSVHELIPVIRADVSNT